MRFGLVFDNVLWSQPGLSLSKKPSWSDFHSLAPLYELHRVIFLKIFSSPPLSPIPGLPQWPICWHSEIFKMYTIIDSCARYEINVTNWRTTVCKGWEGRWASANSINENISSFNNSGSARNWKFCNVLYVQICSKATELYMKAPPQNAGVHETLTLTLHLCHILTASRHIVI